jgi:hypothetical protein
MHLVQLLLPLADNAGHPFGQVAFEAVKDELTRAFGGVTAHVQAPAEGAWVDAAGERADDRIVIFEVMTGTLDRAWWADYRATLETRFRQDEVVVRALHAERL